MGSINGAANGIAGLAARIPAETPKKPVETKHGAQPQAKVSSNKDGIDNPASLFAVRTGIDFASLTRARLNTIIDQSQNREAENTQPENKKAENSAKTVGSGVTDAKELGGLKPSDIFGPMPLDTSVITKPLISYYKGVIEGGKIVFDTARQVVNDRIASNKDVNDIGKLGEGDSIVTGGKGSLSYQVGVGEEIALEIKCTKKDPQTGETEYTVTFEGAPELSGSLGNFGGSVNAGLKTEYKFKNAEEIKRYDEIMGKGIQCNIAGAKNVLSKEDAEFLNQHISSVEIKTATTAQYDGKFGIGGVVEVGVQPGVKIQPSVRIEFENGKPVSLVRVTELSGSSVGRYGLNLLKSKTGGAGGESNDLTEMYGKAIDVKGTITVETKIPLDKAEMSDVADIIANPLRFATSDKAENTVKFAGEFDGGKSGGQYELEISKLSGSEAKQIIEKTLQNKPGEALQNVEADVKSKTSVFEDKGTNINLDFKIAGYGVEYAVRNERRDVTVVAQSDEKDKVFSPQK